MEILLQDIYKVFQVASNCNLQLNFDKCIVLRFSRGHILQNVLEVNLRYKINGTALKMLQLTNDLGVIVDRGLKFHNHVSKMVYKAAGLANSLLRSTPITDPEFIVTLFVTHMRPLLDCCSCVLNVDYL